MTDSAAVRCLLWTRRARWTGRVHRAGGRRSPVVTRAATTTSALHGPAAVADRVLLVIARARPSSAPRGPSSGRNAGSYPNPPQPRGSVGEPTVAAADEDPSLARRRIDVGERADVASAGSRPAPRAAASRGSPRRSPRVRRSEPSARPARRRARAASMPESSAIAGTSASRRRRRAALAARSRRTSCRVLRRQLDLGRQRLDRHPGGASSRSNSLSLWGLRVASTSEAAAVRDIAQRAVAATACVLERAQLLDADRGERQQIVEVGARERRALGRRLHLDQAARRRSSPRWRRPPAAESSE